MDTWFRLCCRICCALTILLVFCLKLTAQPFWEQTRGPYGGIIHNIVITPNGTVFTGTWHGIYRSTNTGGTWEATSNGIEYVSQVHAMAVDSTGRIYAYIGRLNSISSSNAEGGLYTSTDNGASWYKSPFDFPYGAESMTVDRKGYVFVGTNGGGMYRSTDQGATWKQTGFADNYGTIHTLAIDSQGIIYAGVHNLGMYRSTDGGNSWWYDNLEPEYGDITALAFSNGDVIAGSSDDIYRRRNLGWQKITPKNSEHSIQDLAVSPNGSIFASTWYTGVLRSTDHGVSWTIIDSAITPMPHHAVAVNRDGVVLLGSYGNGMYRSTTNGDTWQQVETGIIDSYVMTLFIDQRGEIFAGSNAGLHRSTDGGTTWSRTGNGLVNRYHLTGGDITAIATSGDTMYTTMELDGIFRSTDRGERWVSASTGISLSYRYFRSLGRAPNGHLFTGAHGIYRSIDNGESWQERSVGLRDSTIFSIVFDSANAVYAGTANGIFRSVDDGEHWSRLRLPVGRTSQLLVLPDGSILVAAGGLYRFRIESDTVVNIPITDTTITNRNQFLSLAIGQGGEIYTGSRIDGVYQSTDNGNTWHSFGTGLPPLLHIQALAVTDNGRLLAGTSGGGVFSINTTPSGIAEQRDSRLQSCIEATALPNPTSSAVEIRFHLATSGYVAVRVYSQLGNTIATLASGYMENGTHSLIWNTEGLPAGIWYYSIILDEDVTTGEIVIIR